MIDCSQSVLSLPPPPQARVVSPFIHPSLNSRIFHRWPKIRYSCSRRVYNWAAIFPKYSPRPSKYFYFPSESTYNRLLFRRDNSLGGGDKEEGSSRSRDLSSCLLFHVVNGVADGVALGGQARRREYRQADRRHLQGLHQERQWNFGKRTKIFLYFPLTLFLQIKLNIFFHRLPCPVRANLPSSERGKYNLIKI